MFLLFLLHADVCYKQFLMSLVHLLSMCRYSGQNEGLSACRTKLAYQVV